MTTTGSATRKPFLHRAEHAASQPWVEWLVRFGFVIRGLLYFIIGALALQLAIGVGGATTNLTGAIALIGRLPLGKALLVITAVGLAGYSLWGFVRAILDPLGRGTRPKGIVERIGFFLSGLSYGALLIPMILSLMSQSGGQSSGNPNDLSAQLWTKPFGPWLVAGFGLFWIIAAVAQGYAAYTAYFTRELKTSAMSAGEIKIAKRIGRIGFAARGAVFGLIGLFIVQSAFTANAHRAQGFDGALGEIAGAPYGRILLGAVAIGLVLFGAYSVITAKWHDNNSGRPA